jgi:Na+/H+-dicarboxylate symporter
MAQYFILAFVCTFGSIGAAGLPAGSLIFMPMVLAAVGIPADGIASIVAVDRILDMVRTMTNITGDCALALALDSSEGNLNREEYYEIEKKMSDSVIIQDSLHKNIATETDAETW